MNRRQTHLYAALLGWAWAAGGASAETAELSAPTTQPAEVRDASRDKIDDKSAEVLSNMSTYLAEQPSFQVDAEQTVAFGADPAMPEIRVQYRLSVQRPNLIAVAPLEAGKNPSIICDGSHLFVCVPGLRKYTRSPAPESMDGILNPSTLGALATTGRPLIWLAAFAHSEPKRLILQDIASAKYLGQAAVDGRLCHHLALTQPSLAWQIWVSTGERPIPVQIALDLSVPTPAATQPSAPGSARGLSNTSQPAAAALHATLQLKEWKFHPTIPVEVFHFAPPPSVSEVGSLIGQTPTTSAAVQGGNPAPKFEAEVIGGGHLSLAEHLGRQPIVLCFFVTWRRSSADTLAALAAFRESSPASSWESYLINVDEPMATVRAYLERHRVVQPVVLDPQGAIAGMYGVGRTPCTVLIDADGNIAAFYEAIPADDLRQKLTHDLGREAGTPGKTSPASAPTGEPAARQESHGAEGLSPRG